MSENRTQCVDCEDGTWSSASATECDQCHDGTVPTSDKSGCEECRAVSFRRGMWSICTIITGRAVHYINNARPLGSVLFVHNARP